MNGTDLASPTLSHEDAARALARLSDAIETSSEGFMLFGPDERLEMWNSRISEAFAGRIRLQVGMSHDEFLRQKAAAGYDLAAQGREEDWMAERRAEFRSAGSHVTQSPDGQFHLVRHARTSDGGTTLIRTNVTELHRRESELREAKEAAEQANIAKTRFLAAASHDLRQPLQALGLFTATLAARPLRDEEKAIVGKLEASLEALEGLLDSLLDISKLDAGIIEPVVRTVDLGALFARLAVEFEPLAATKGLELRVVPPATAVSTDPKLIERVLRNLLSNAIRYTERGGILIACRKRGGMARIEVRDTGRGIPADQLGEIFREFYQLDNPARDRRKGLGLGLAIVQRIADLLGHSIGVRSTPGRGSCFALTLAAAADENAAPCAAAVPGLEISGHNVLVIDDDAAVLEGLRILLQAWGCHVVTADSAASALSAIERSGQVPHVVVADYRLRDRRTGAEAIAAVRQALGRDIPALLITGDTAPQRLRQALQHGYPLLHKPVRPDRLRSELADALSRGRASTGPWAGATRESGSSSMTAPEVMGGLTELSSKRL